MGDAHAAQPDRSPLPHTLWAQRGGVAGGTGCVLQGLGGEQTQKSRRRVSWGGLPGRGDYLGRHMGLAGGRQPKHAKLGAGALARSWERPPLSPLTSAFQSPKRSSASGSAPRDSTRRVRSSELVPPPPPHYYYHGAGAGFGAGSGAARPRTARSTVGRRCERARAQPRLSLPATTLTHGHDINSAGRAEPRLAARERVPLLLSPLPLPGSGVGASP